jgi:hypothetical protein
MLKRKLKGSSFGDPEIIKSMVDAFEEKVSDSSLAIDGWAQLYHARQLKPKFDGTMDTYNLRFSCSDDNDSRLGIHKGEITISNQEIKPLFDTVIDKIVTNCFDTLISQKTEVMYHDSLLHPLTVV